MVPSHTLGFRKILSFLPFPLLQAQVNVARLSMKVRCLKLHFYCCHKPPKPKATWGGKRLICTFYGNLSVREVRPGTQGRNLDTGAGRGHGGMLLTGLFSMAYSACFLKNMTQNHLPRSGLAPRELALTHQSRKRTTDLPTSKSYWRHFLSLRVPLLQ